MIKVKMKEGKSMVDRPFQLTTNFKEGFLSDIAVSERNVDHHSRYIAEGDQYGNILIWQECILQKWDLPCANLNYEGQVYDLLLIQNEDTQVQVLLSLHMSS